ncbi:MAG: glycosyltransferase family 4 protein [Acidobacteria bacterium]|nr:glycosyltransferase family 4 protein [Acidobacteriota bacterium]
MRLAYFADIRLPLERANGIQTMETCAALASRGHEVWLIARPDTQDPRRDPYEYYGIARSGRFQIETAPVAGPQFARRLGYLAFALGRALGRGRGDLLFTRDLGVAAMFASVPAGTRPPFVYESHGYAPDVAAELPQLVATAKPAGRAKLKRLASREALVWREASGYVTITRSLAEALRGRFGDRDNLAVVPDGVRLSPGRTYVPRVEGEPVVVGYAGHLYAWKGVDLLLEALARLPAVRGLIVGGHDAEGDLARVRAGAERLGIAGRVEFTGLVPPSAVPPLLARAAILVLPNLPTTISTHFTSPLKLFEYMAAGRAIVASDLPAIREVLTDDVNAVLVAPGDAAALARGIERLAADPSTAARLGRAAFDAADGYTWERRAERLDAVLERARTR